MKRVEGIQELKQMDIKDGYQPLFKLVKDRNHLVRLEAILARMKMDVNPLSLFGELEDDLTDWEQLRIHNLLHRLPLQDIPSFLPLLDHKLTSVQLFGVKMVALFNQADTESLLIKKLGNTATKLNLHIVESLADIGSEKSVQRLHKTYGNAEDKLKVNIINTLYKIAGESDAQFFTNQLSIENYDIKLAAAKAIVKLQEKGDSVNVEELELVPVETQNIIDHARQWRNQ
jgi:hypothetical protein